MVEQPQTWYIITTNEKLIIEAHFLEPCRNTPDAHITTFARQLDRRQVECKDHGVTVTKAKKVDHFVAHMYICDLFEPIFWTNGRRATTSCGGGAQPHFTKQYAHY